MQGISAIIESIFDRIYQNARYAFAKRSSKADFKQGSYNVIHWLWWTLRNLLFKICFVSLYLVMWGVIFPLKSVYFVKYSNIWSPLCQWIIFTKRKDFRMLKNTIKLLVILQIHYEIWGILAVSRPPLPSQGCSSLWFSYKDVTKGKASGNHWREIAAMWY